MWDCVWDFFWLLVSNCVAKSKWEHSQSQDGWSWNGHLEVILPSCPAQAGHLKQVAQNHAHKIFKDLQRWRLHNLPMKPTPVLSHPQNKKKKKKKEFPDVQKEPQVSPFRSIASGPVTSHHWKEPDFLSHTLFSDIYVPWWDPSLSFLFSRLGSPRSRPVLTGQMLSHLHGPLLDSCQFSIGWSFKCRNRNNSLKAFQSISCTLDLSSSNSWRIAA